MGVERSNPMKELTVALLLKGDFVLEERHLQRLRVCHPQVEFRECNPDTVSEAELRDADAMVGWPSAQMLKWAPKLRWLMLPSVGVNRYLEIPELRPEAVLTNSRGVFGIAGAEHGLALLLALVRDLPRQFSQQREKVWKRSRECREIHGSTIGVLGLGDIGSAFARSAAALGARVLGLRRSAAKEKPPGVEACFTPAELDTYLPRMDAVFAALPETPETIGLLSRERIFSMKRGAFFVNVGRGSLVDEPALIEALADGYLGGAGLDVTAREPLPPESPLWELPNVIISSHSLGIYPRKQDFRAELIEENVGRLLRGEPLKNAIDRKLGY